jgi:hypothetical protein
MSPTFLVFYFNQQKSQARHAYKVSCLLLPLQALFISRCVLLSSPFKFLIILSMADEDSLQDSQRGVPGNIDIVSGVKGLLCWSVPWFKSQLGSLVSAAKGLLCGSVPISRKKKRCPHCEHRTRAKAKDRVHRWRRRALPIALVVRCWRRSSNKAPRLASDIFEPVHWKWKKKKVCLSSVIKTKFASTSSCAIPKCQSCELAPA